MRLNYKREFHEWANSISFDEVLEDCEICKEGIECLYCGSDKKEVYYVFWKNDSDFYCTDCLKEFLKNDLPERGNNGHLAKRFQVFSRDNFKCVYCGRNPIDHNTVLEIEHVHPKAKGGRDSVGNLVTACWECNRGKGDSLLSERQKMLVIRNRV